MSYLFFVECHTSIDEVNYTQIVPSFRMIQKVLRSPAALLPVSILHSPPQCSLYSNCLCLFYSFTTNASLALNFEHSYKWDRLVLLLVWPSTVIQHEMYPSSWCSHCVLSALCDWLPVNLHNSVSWIFWSTVVGITRFLFTFGFRNSNFDHLKVTRKVF